MELRHILLIIALLSSAVFASPTINSLFAGEHYFYNNSIPCLKCHADIRNELDSSLHHRYFTCDNCHLSSSALSHGNVTNPRCLDCHGTPPKQVTDSRGNTYLSPIASIFGENTSNRESHSAFVEGANSTLLMKGENEACIACHTTKSIRILIRYADSYAFKAKRANNTWQIFDYMKNAEHSNSITINANQSHSVHSFIAIPELRCEKCHPNIREELNNSLHHTYFSCNTCHEVYSYHASNTPTCLYCHATNRIVVDMNNNTYITPIASVYSGNMSGADAHIPFVSSANNSNFPNTACTSCHSSFNTNITFTRPSYIEWDVINNSKWVITNLTFGPLKNITVTKFLDGKAHNISGVDCVSCHDDIKQAVINGGHSNEQWKSKHNYTNYFDMKSYCESCHNPITMNNNNESPYPAYPFNSSIHGAMSLSCMDCHGKTDILVNMNGWKSPPYNSSAMHNIEDSIAQQPMFVRSYLCIACKNTGNPKPNNSLHFKLYTEPEIVIYVNGVKQYP